MCATNLLGLEQGKENEQREREPMSSCDQKKKWPKIDQRREEKKKKRADRQIWSADILSLLCL